MASSAGRRCLAVQLVQFTFSGFVIYFMCVLAISTDTRYDPLVG